ncbi:MAG TPA: HPF/RaiA family ribosome-associated protein [Gemmatimonadales bacterium]|nr:HPF/RaiA family ribosome-associated protein [Gemmatimonadales bacterium]
MADSRRKRTQRRAPMGTAANVRPRATRGRTPSTETPVAIIAPDLRGDEDFREHARRRAGFRLGKLAYSIERVSIRVHRIGGPRGAPAYRCRVKVMLPRFETIIVEEVERVPQDALDRAMDVAERAVRRALTRRRRKARRPRAG